MSFLKKKKKNFCRVLHLLGFSGKIKQTHFHLLLCGLHLRTQYHWNQNINVLVMLYVAEIHGSMGYHAKEEIILSKPRQTPQRTPAHPLGSVAEVLLPHL